MKTSLPLSGTRVLDFSRLLPGPYATLVLADLGADVIKVEAPKGGDYLRWMPPLSGKTSYRFAALNSGKRSLAVDLKSPAGVRAIKALASDSDIVVESFRPGVMDRLGLGYDALSSVNPKLIYCAISGYGQTGPYRDRAGHDLNYQALAGVLGQTGPAEAPPTLPAVQVADIGGGALWSLVGILSALHQRTQTGKGQLVDISMTEGCLSFLHMALASYLGGGAPPPIRGKDTLTGGEACYGVYETQDGAFFTVGALEPKFWLRLCTVLERPDLVNRQYGRTDQVNATREELQRLFRTRTRQEWETLLGEMDACCEPVLNVADLMTHPLHQARQNIIKDSSGMQRLRTPLRPGDASPPEAPPLLGQHTRSILSSAGFSAVEIDNLLAEGGAVETLADQNSEAS